MSQWGIIGDGNWGMALARRLLKNGHEVIIAGLEKRKRGIPKGAQHSTELGTVLSAAERLIFAVPIGVFEHMLRDAAPHLRSDHRVVSTARGLTPETHLRATEAIRNMTAVRQIAVLAGAADAEALARASPIALVVGTAFPSWSSEIQEALGSRSLRVYANQDLVGVELSNVAAAVVGVALGVAHAMKVGPAAEATALTRALAEMDRVVSGLGGLPGTANGLAGLGVLGEMIYDAQGASYRAGGALASEDLEAAVTYAEVRESARTLSNRIGRERIRAPLVGAVEEMFGGKLTAKDALTNLMERPVGLENH